MSAKQAITDWAGKRVWIVGASSGIGEALAQQLARRGAVLALSARRAEPLQAILADAPEGSVVLPLDVTDELSVMTAVSSLSNNWESIDLVVWLAGTYTPMRAQSFDLKAARSVMDANIMGPLNGLGALLPQMLKQGHGGIALVSSVAGYRGLPKSLVYGPSKAALTNLAEALYIDLRETNIGVWVINPGFVETPLTAQNDFKMPALISTDEAARAIIEGFASGRFEIHFPKRFTMILKIMRTLPYRLYFAAVSKLVKA
ncbi:MAG: SDR family NAD(P)-dependent oxidoreductase [Burkholderiaceae bacterium]